MHIGIRNNKLTNRLIQLLIVAGDFAVLSVLLYYLVGTIPQSEGWDEEKERAFWMVCTFALIIAEYLFPSVIHERVVGANDILQRSTMLIATHTLISYLLLRAIQFLSRVGWQLFVMGLVMLVSIILLRFIERWLVKMAHTEQYDKLIDKYMVRHFVRPGITGWAQVTGFRGETRELWQMEGRVERDIWYIQHWSFWLDLRIIWMTVKTIFVRDKNAY